jgi:hypothetical protein
MESDSEAITRPVYSPDPNSEIIPNSGAPTSVSDFNFSLTSSQDPVTQPSETKLHNILCDFYNSDSENKKEEEDIPLNFDSDSGAGMSRKPGERYAEFDFDFLDENWLKLTDESSDQFNSDSGSTD